MSFGAGKEYSALIVDLESPLVSSEALAKIIELQAAGLPVAAVGKRPAGVAGLGGDDEESVKLGKQLFDSAKSPRKYFQS